MLRSVLGVLITVMAATAGEGAEVKILAALAVQDALGPIGASFARDSGHSAQIAYSTVGAIRQRLAAHERADVVIVTAEAAEDMHRLGQLSDPMPLAATRTGVAIREGATAPKIATIEQFRAALLAARSVAYTDPESGGAFGTYFAGELDRMGIAQAVNAKAVLRRGSHQIVRGRRQRRGRAGRDLHQHDRLDAGPEGGRPIAAAAPGRRGFLGRPSR